MIIPYKEFPGDIGEWPRPLLDIAVADMEEMRVRCLVDSGAVNTLLPRWVAEFAGLDLGDAQRSTLGVGGMATDAAFTTTRLTAGEHRWEAEVGFCDPWPYEWGLLGQRSFFRFFIVTFRAADLEFEILPDA